MAKVWLLSRKQCAVWLGAAAFCGFLAGTLVPLAVAKRALHQRNAAMAEAREALRIAEKNNQCVAAVADAAMLWDSILHADKNIVGYDTTLNYADNKRRMCER